jgi:hypothetical protein
MRALERALRELVLGPPVAAGDRAAVDAWLARSGASGDEAGALRSQIARLAVYRDLVRTRLRSVLELQLPRFRARLGAVFDDYFERFLCERGPRTHYLRDVTTEFLDFMEPLAAADPRVPPWALELARHEALDVFVGSLAESPRPAELTELDADRWLAFTETARLVRYSFAVHRLSAGADDRSEPARDPTALLVYRSPEHDVRYLELTPLAAAVLERLLAGRTLRNALEGATSALDTALDAAVLEGTARVLAELAERGAVTGARAPAAAADLQNAQEPTENAGKRREPKRTG